jgi:HK97 family phage major capsid protein
MAEEVYADVLDGIRSNVSVGYMIHRMVEEGDKKNPTLRATDWQPFEVSLVSVPADFKVGIGREVDTDHETEITKAEEEIKAEKETIERTKPMSEENTPVVEKIDIEQETRKAVEKRNSEIKSIRQFGEAWGCEKEALQAIEDEKSMDEARELILKAVEARNKTIEAEAPKQKREVEFEETLRYDRKALRGWEGCKDAERQAYSAGKWVQAVMFGSEDAKRWVKDNLGERVMNSAVGSEGGYTVPDELENAIINLRNEYGKVRQLARVYPMSTSSLQIPKRASGTTAYFLDEATATTASDASLDQVELVAKELSALTRISKTLAEDSVIDIAAMVADEQAYSFAVKEDECWINGDGTSTYGGMQGLVPLFEATAYGGRVTTTSGDDTFEEIISSDLSKLLSVCPSYAKMGAVWLSSPTADDLVFGRLAAAGGGNTIQNLNGSTGMSYLGYGRETAEPCPSGAATDYTSKAMLFFGNFAQGTAMGERRGLTVQVLNERYAEYRQVGIISTERISIVNHDLGDTSTAGAICCLYGNT